MNDNIHKISEKLDATKIYLSTYVDMELRYLYLSRNIVVYSFVEWVILFVQS